MAKTSNTPKDDQAEASLISVTVIKEGHTHAGQSVAVGESITVDAETSAWLRAQNIIEE